MSQNDSVSDSQIEPASAALLYLREEIEKLQSANDISLAHGRDPRICAAIHDNLRAIAARLQVALLIDTEEREK